MGLFGGQVQVGDGQVDKGVSWARDKRWTGIYGDSWATGDGKAGVGLVVHQIGDA